MSRRCSEVIELIHRVIDREIAHIASESKRPMRLLDVGCWDGITTSRWREMLGGDARGIEVFPEQAEIARGRGVEVAEIDLETERFPWEAETVDVVVANQVFEHLKNVWLPMSEISRVVVPGGYFIFSVPNLASLHNRLMLAAGLQPSSIRTFGPHIRGFTFAQARDFLEWKGFFRVERSFGVGFYPIPGVLSAPFASGWKAASHTPVFVARRVAPSRTEPPWLSQTAGEQTFYET